MADDKDSIAGIVVYHQGARGWEGLWSHVSMGGVLAREAVDGADLDSLPGQWPVRVMLPDGALLFSGQLAASTLGACIKLVWTGQMHSGEAASFDGIGYRTGPASLAATFQQHR